MENMKKFALNYADFVYGGRLLVTTCGGEVCDAYDTDKERIIYL